MSSGIDKVVEIQMKKNKIHLISSVLVSIFLFILYLSMISFEYSDANYGVDAGDLLSAILTDGIPHPSGYPTFLLLGKLFQYLPFGTPYFKGSLISAFFSSIAAGLLTLFSGRIFMKEKDTIRSAFLPVTTGIALGLSPFFWSQSVIVEVYGLAAFFFVILVFWLYLMVNGQITKKSDIWITVLSILVGVGFGNHLMIGLMLPCMIYAVAIFLKNGNQPRHLIKYFIFMLTACALVYAILPIRASKNPVVNWGNPQTLEGFIWLVSGKLYQGLAFKIPRGEILDRISFFAGLLQKQFGFIGLIIGLLGLVRVASLPNKMKWIYFWTVIAYPVFSIGYLTNDSVVYLIPAFIIFAIFIGYGLLEIGEKLKKPPRLTEIVLSVAFLLFLFMRIPGLIAEIDPRRDLSAKQFAEKCINKLPQNAIILTEEDRDTFPLWYYHFGLGRRPDIHVIVQPLLAYEWYQDSLTHTYPDVLIPGGESMVTINQVAESNPEIPVCNTNYKLAETNQLVCECLQ